MEQPFVWLIEPEASLRSILRELYLQEGYAVVDCRSGADVYTHLLGGASGVVVADVSQLAPVRVTDELDQLRHLAKVVPVLLLVDKVGPAVVSGCQVLVDPYADLDRLAHVTHTLISNVPVAPPAFGGSF